MGQLLLYVAFLVFSVLEMLVINASKPSALGEGFFLPEKDLFGEFIRGASIFEPFPASCFDTVENPETKQVSTYFKTSYSFYEYVSNRVSLTGSMIGEYTMGATLRIASDSISGESLQTSGISLDIYGLKSSLILSQDCINSQPLTKTFLADFQALPVQIKDPNLPSDWTPYNSFLKKYGSHFLKEINNGTRLQQWVFATQSKMYTQRDFNIRACVDLSQDTGSLKVNLCGNYTKEEKEEVSKMTMSSKLQIKGGTAKTRAQLRNERSAELIQKFLLEAQTAPGHVLYEWTAVWDLLKQRSFGASGENLARTMNLEAYYKGLLDFGCTKTSKNGVDLRWFEKGGAPQQPEYYCKIAPEGCRDGNRDCHLGGSGSSCYCYGPTCVDSQPVNNPNSKIKVERVIRTSQKGSYKSGINNSCHYHFIAHCNCNRKWGGEPTQIWPSTEESESRQLLFALHNKTMKIKGSHNGAVPGYGGNAYRLYALLCLTITLLLY